MMKLKLSDFFRFKIIPSIAAFIIKSISLTIDIRYIGKENVEKAIKEGKKIIFAFWHGRQFLLVNAHRKMDMVIMTSLSKDGEIQTRILQKFGYKCVRGSSSKNAVAGLKALTREVRLGKNSAIAVDGPKGPRYVVKEGIFFTAAVSGAVIVPVSSSAKPRYIFKDAWDEYLLPMPFSKAVIAYSKPIEVKKDDDFSILSLKLKDELDELTKVCEEYVLKL